MSRFRKDKGFTLIELLIVVAIIGILAAIAIPNLLTAMQKSKQKRTMADIRSIATAWEAYAVDENHYTPPAYTILQGDELTYDELKKGLAPHYIKNLPQNDGWDNPYEYHTDLAANAQAYQIISGGKNGTIGTDEGPAISGPTDNFECDIVYSNGSFVVFPEGKQN